MFRYFCYLKVPDKLEYNLWVLFFKMNFWHWITTSRKMFFFHDFLVLGSYSSVWLWSSHYDKCFIVKISKWVDAILWVCTSEVSSSSPSKWHSILKNDVHPWQKNTSICLCMIWRLQTDVNQIFQMRYCTPFLGQEVTKIPQVKIGGQKKNCWLSLIWQRQADTWLNWQIYFNIRLWPIVFL